MLFLTFLVNVLTMDYKNQNLLRASIMSASNSHRPVSYTHLHSNKTKKSAVISQLRETTEIIKQTSPEEFKKEAERL